MSFGAKRRILNVTCHPERALAKDCPAQLDEDPGKKIENLISPLLIGEDLDKVTGFFGSYMSLRMTKKLHPEEGSLFAKNR